MHEDWRHYLFGFHGRATRMQWWLFVLIFVVYNFVVTALCVAIFGFLGLLIGWVLMLVMLWPWLAVSERRLHDRGKSGLWLLLFYLGPFLLGATKLALYGDLGVSGIAYPSGPSIAISFAEFVIIIWALIELGVLRGTVGDNKYGPDPLAAPKK